MTPLPTAFLDRPITHRALHGPDRPENGLNAISAAVEAGFGIEIDLQLSADGRAMVFHDDLLDRLTAEIGPVREREASELQRIPLNGGAGETIPTLEEVLNTVDGKAPLLIEIKDQDGGLGPDIGTLEEAVARDLRGYDGPVALMSFNPYAVAAMANLTRNIPLGLTTCAFDRLFWGHVPDDRRAAHARMDMLDSCRASFISHEHHDLTSDPVQQAKARGLHVLCWTIRSPKDAEQALVHADNITFEGYLP